LTIRPKKIKGEPYFQTQIPTDFLSPGEGRKYITAKTKSEVREKYEVEIERRKAKLKPGKLKLGEFLNKFLDRVKAGEAQEIEISTFSDYRYHIGHHITPFIGEIPLSDLEADRIDQWRGEYRNRVSDRGRPYSARTMNYSLSVLHNALNYAVRWKHIAVNPAAAAYRSRQGKTVEPITADRVFSPEEVNAMIEAAKGGPYDALFRVAFGGGMRKGEIMGLQWEALDLDRGRVAVHRSWSQTKQPKSEGPANVLKSTKNRKSIRTIKLPEDSIAALRAHADLTLRTEGKLSGFVFTTGNGTPYDQSNLNRPFKKLAASLGIKRRVTFYDSRHTHATLLLQNGTIDHAIGGRLGHSSTRLVNDLYAHFRPEADDKSAETFDRIFADAKKKSEDAKKQEAGKVLPMRKREAS
jgi:integrase